MAYSSSDNSAFIKEVWLNEFQDLLDTLIVLKGIVNDVSADPQFEKGDVFHKQTPDSVTTNTLTKYATLSLDQLNATDENLAADQFRYQLFGVDAIDEMQGNPRINAAYKERSAVSMANNIDTRLMTHYADANASNVTGSTSVPITLTPDNVYDYFSDKHENLDDFNNEFDGNEERHAVVTPKTRNIIRKSQEMRGRGSDLVDETVRNGKVGKFVGWSVHVTTNITTVSSSDPHMFFTKQFITYVEQMSKMTEHTPRS